MKQTPGRQASILFASICLLSAAVACDDTTAPAATQLVLSTAAAGASSGVIFDTQPVVEFRDAAGNKVSSAIGSVTMTVSDGATVLGTSTVTAMNGVATFSNVGIRGTAGANYTLTFTAAGMTSATQVIGLTPGAPSQLVLTRNAAGAASGAPFTTQPIVELRDADGNIVTGSVAAVTMTVSTGATVVGTSTVTANNGAATFSNVGISGTAGTTYTLTFTTPGLPAVTQTISPSAGAVASVFVTPATMSLLFEQGPLSVEARDAAGNPVSAETVAWSSSNNSVATVNETGQTGLVTPVSEGEVTITATVNGKTGSARITILPITFADLSAGWATTCGLTSAGSTYCWGTEYVGEAGSRLNPFLVPGGVVFAVMDFGGLHGCGLTEAGKAYCWGRNLYGQIGDGSTVFGRASPVEVQGGHSFTSIDAGGEHNCALTSAGAAFCWGWNHAGQTGDGTIDNSRRTPVAVLGGHSFTQLTAGGAFTCGLTTAGTAYCWGRNLSGQLGDGSTMYRPTPVPVQGGLSFSSLVAGENHTCGVTTAGRTYCWGLNSDAQLGDGTTTTHQVTPTAVVGAPDFASLTAGREHTCGITNTGAAYCWGANSEGQLGDGTTIPRASPTPVSGDLNFRLLTAGGFHTCGLTTESRPYCWGHNNQGQVGDGTQRIARLTPTPVDRQ